MAGSTNHVFKERVYVGTNLLENMGDMTEAVDEMAFIIGSLWHRWGGELIVPPLIDQYYRCMRGEEPFPTWWQPEDIDL
jgi:hypothetical protein